jgi:hypothetical protein
MLTQVNVIDGMCVLSHISLNCSNVLEIIRISFTLTTAPAIDWLFKIRIVNFRSHMAYMYESFDGSHISVRSTILTTVHVYCNFSYSIVIIIQKLEHYLSQLILQ